MSESLNFESAPQKKRKGSTSSNHSGHSLTSNALTAKKKRITSAGAPGKNDQSLIQRILTNLCHSLAINEEMAFDADLKRFANILED